MKILLVNDDGILSQGIRLLADKLSDFNHVVVIAPEMQASNSSHTMSFKIPVNYVEVNLSEKYRAYAVKGTPIDCVKFGIDIIMKDKPDFIISGINDSPNIGTDVLYSGTVNAAIEGAILGIKSIAVSQEGKNFNYSADFILNNLDFLYKAIFNNDFILNINIPENPKDIVITETGHRQYKDWYEYIEGEGYYLKGYTLKSDKNLYKTDAEYFDENYITVSPIKINFNDIKALKYLKDNLKLKK